MPNYVDSAEQIEANMVNANTLSTNKKSRILRG